MNYLRIIFSIHKNGMNILWFDRSLVCLWPVYRSMAISAFASCPTYHIGWANNGEASCSTHPAVTDHCLRQIDEMYADT